jgi:D-alanine-D-alanine ligase
VLDGKALPVIEIIPPENEEFDYDNKYNGKTRELCPAINVAGDVQIKAQKLAETVHSLTGARHLSRIDIMVTPDEDLYVLELNTIPGLTEQSLFPKAAQSAGISMPDLVKRFYEMVVRDYSLD